MKTVNLEKLLPEDIPPGERILWHGRPNWIALFRGAYRADFVAGYFILLATWNAIDASGAGAAACVIAAARALTIGVAALSLLALLAWASARTALFVITSRRVVMKIGVALQVFYNLPFSQIRSADLRVESDGTGEVTLQLTAGKRIGYLHLWPFARPFHFADPEPALRGMAQARQVGEILGRALIVAANERGAAVNAAPEADVSIATEARVVASDAVAA
ncbi:photosynthetic complex putative assembly protein PuhB [Methylocystis echinoides]|uniref:Photosynthetic complex assembly protein n=1 Tax=Methylocystis echinoides TaxID=29468 RepID=A0A9W6LTS6_9HYPH|nr:photosynthetic complex putative assembly protein PuhB [Methylocystis echinoides]GLI94837.1 photosynthetic complex assembly protein [Methylocystis echinoides]